MSYVIATPDMLAAAASDLTNIGSALGAANSAALARTTGLLAAAEDEVSTAIASLFSASAREYQIVSTQAAHLHAEFVHSLTRAGAGPGQRMHEFGVQVGSLGADDLVFPGAGGKQRRDGRGYLVFGSGQQPGGPGQRRGIGGAKSRADIGQIRCRCREHVWRRDHIRHPVSPYPKRDALAFTVALIRRGPIGTFVSTWELVGSAAPRAWARPIRRSPAPPPRGHRTDPGPLRSRRQCRAAAHDQPDTVPRRAGRPASRGRCR